MSATRDETSDRIPLRAMAIVCVPQTSITRTGGPSQAASIRATAARPRAGSRNSSMYFNGTGKLPEEGERLRGLLLVHLLDGEPRMEDDIFTGPDVVQEQQGDLPPRSPHVRDAQLSVDLDDLDR